MRATVLFALLSISLHAQTVDKDIRRIDSLIAASSYAEALTVVDDRLQQQRDPAAKVPLLAKKSEIQLFEGKLAAAEETLKAIEQLNLKDQRSVALYDTYSGLLQLNRGRYDLALEKLNQAYLLLQQDPAANAEYIADCVGFLSLAYLSTGKYQQAEDNALVALQLRLQLYGENHEEVAAAYNDLGLVYTEGDPDKALEYYEKGLAAYQKLHGSEHAKIAIANTNIGFLYSSVELYGDAVNNLEAALAIWKKIYPAGHPNQAFVQRNLGQVYFNMGNRTAAIAFFQQALEQYRKSYGEKHPDISSTLNQMAILHLQEAQYETALGEVQQAIAANIPNFNSTDPAQDPPLSEYYNPHVLVYSLRLKAQAYEELHFGKTLKRTDLEKAIINLDLADALIDDIRHHSPDEADKITVAGMANEVYEDGVRVSTALSEMSLKPKVQLEKAFYFAEKSKSAVLQESIADTQAKSFAGIPAALLEEEKNLKSTIAFLTQKLGQKPSADEEKYLRESLLALKQEYDGFTKRLEKEFPNYYNLKFNTASPVVADFQRLLKPDEAIVSYFIAAKGKRLYQFVITSKSFTGTHVSMPDNFDRLTRGFNNGIYFRSFETYRRASEGLTAILRPRVPGRIKELIIVPAGRLSTMPFEALAMNPKKAESFADVDYLASRFAISYEFSVGLIAQKSRATGSTQQPSILLCAPVTFPAKANVPELPGTETEVRKIAQLFGSASKLVITNKEANEAIVKSKDIEKYNYLHFATHGIVDESDPEQSKIFLYDDQTEDGDLFAAEIYNLSLNAELAVLSACQTGLGKYSEGEGVIGLSRALVYAGAKNLMVSFWSVADESTSQLMTDFYTVLLKDPSQGFRNALQGAKMKMIGEKKYSEPYYWAAFVLVGF